MLAHPMPMQTPSPAFCDSPNVFGAGEGGRDVKDWLNWTVYFGSFELCNLWYPTLLSCVTVVISLYRGPPFARPNVFGVLACGFFVSFVFCWVYIDAFMYLVRESAVIYKRCVRLLLQT